MCHKIWSAKFRFYIWKMRLKIQNEIWEVCDFEDNEVSSSLGIGTVSLLFLICTSFTRPPRAMSWENLRFAYAKTKIQISCTVTTQLISAFVCYIDSTMTHVLLKIRNFMPLAILWVYSPVCVGPGQNSRRQVFSWHCSPVVYLQVQRLMVWLHGLPHSFCSTWPHY